MHEVPLRPPMDFKQASGLRVFLGRLSARPAPQERQRKSRLLYSLGSTILVSGSHDLVGEF